MLVENNWQCEIPMQSERASADLLKTHLPLLEFTQQYLRSLSDNEQPDEHLLEAWDEFYEMYTTLIRRFIVARGVRGADVDDCVQEVWTSIAKSLGDFEHPVQRPGLRAWLYTVVRSRASDMMRSNNRFGERRLSDSVLASHEPSEPGADPAVLCEREWDRVMVQTAMEDLRPDVSDLNYRVLRARLIEGHDVEEVAEDLKISREQVRYRQHRMLRKLKRKLARFTGQPVADH